MQHGQTELVGSLLSAAVAPEELAASFDDSTDRSVSDVVTVELVIELTLIAGS